MKSDTMKNERIDYIYKNYRIADFMKIDRQFKSFKDLKSMLNEFNLTEHYFDFIIIDNEICQDFENYRGSIKTSGKEKIKLELSNSSSILLINSALDLFIGNNNNNKNSIDIIILELGSSSILFNALFSSRSSITIADMSSSSSNSFSLSSSSSLLLNILSTAHQSKLNISLNAASNSSIILNSAFLMNNASIDSEVLAYNKGSDSSISINSNAALFNDSKCMMKSYAELDKGAKNSISNITHKCLILNENAHADSIPVMSVKEKDSLASHSSSIIPFNDEFAFYANTRGISIIQAKKIEAYGLMLRGINANKHKELLESIIKTVLKMIE